MLIYSIAITIAIGIESVYYYLLQKRFMSLKGIEDLYEQTRKDLGWYKYALDEKQGSYAKIEEVAVQLKKQNVQLKEKITKLEKLHSDIERLNSSSYAGTANACRFS